MITRRDRPVTSSNSSRIVTRSTMSRKTTVPLTSVSVGVVQGAHSTSRLPRGTLLAASPMRHHALAVSVEHDDLAVTVRHRPDVAILAAPRALGAVLGGLDHAA